MKKSNSLIRTAAVIIALSAFMASASVLTSCADGNEANQSLPNDSTSVSGQEAQTAETDISQLSDELPDMDFSGYEFRFVTRDTGTTHSSVTSESESGDIIGDAVYKRNSKIMDRFNFRITENPQSDNNYVRKPLQAGEDAFDAAHLRCTVAVDLFIEGYLHEITDIKYIDLDRPWWSNRLNDSIKIMGSQFLAVGDFNLTSYDFTHMLLANKKLIEDYALDSIYPLISDGQWTFDKMEEYMLTTTLDLNGDNRMDKEDSYGLLSAGKQIPPCFWTAADVLSVKNDGINRPEVNLADEKFVDVFEKIYNITWDSGTWYATRDGQNVPPSSIEMFKNNQGLFMDTTFYFVEKMRDMETDFGIVPYPKYDEKQNDYISRMEMFEPIAVPKINPDIERTGIIIEALTAESRKSVIPAYYDMALKTRNSRDEQSEKMLDIISEGRIADFGDTVYLDMIRDKVIAPMFLKNNRDLMSKIDSMSANVNRQIDELEEAIAQNR